MAPEESTTSDFERAVQLARERIAALPVFRLTFGSVPIEGLPDAVVRDKVLAVLDDCLKEDGEVISSGCVGVSPCACVAETRHEWFLRFCEERQRYITSENSRTANSAAAKGHEL